jgi:hypothetical protein
MSRAKLGITKFLKISRFLLIFLLIFGWIFSGFPRIWQNPPIPPGIGVALSTTALLTGVLAFAILKIVNPPAPSSDRAGFLFLVKIYKIGI